MKTKTWLITGASSGLGRALAQTALDAGEQVVGTARRVERFGDLVERYPEQFLAVQHDVRETGKAQDVVEQALSRFGAIDILVNNAGVGQVGAAEEITDEQLRDMLDQHLFGPAAFVRAVLPSMRKRGCGTIVQMSSQGGRMSFAGVGSYSAGKFALEGWSEALAAEVRSFGIDVLIVEPSRFRTGFNASDVLLEADRSEVYEGVLAAVREDMNAADGVQEGDPERAAGVIRDIIETGNMPLRMPLGAEAVRNLSSSYERSAAEVRANAAMAESADYPGAPTNKRPFHS